MTIDRRLDNGTLTLAVAGRLDTNTAPELEAAVKLDGATALVFDFAGLDYISSAGLRILLTAKKSLMASGGAMSVVNANASVRSVFEITGCSELFGLA